MTHCEFSDCLSQLVVSQWLSDIVREESRMRIGTNDETPVLGQVQLKERNQPTRHEAAHFVSGRRFRRATCADFSSVPFVPAA
jgi:hypothetical protein